MKPASSMTAPVFTMITGASNGLGREMAIECAEQGYHVILIALPGRNLNLFCGQLEKTYGIIARYYETDLTSRREIHFLTKDILRHYRVNFLINNAGTGGTLPFAESSVDYIDRIIRLNITAVSLLTRLMIPELQRHPEGYILNVSSMAAFSPIPYKTVYPASKAFVTHFSRSLGEELKGTAVKVSVLHPGPILTNPDVILRIIRQGANGKRGLLPARKLARIAIHGTRKGKQVIIPGLTNKVSHFLMSILPSMVVLPFLSRVISNELKTEKNFAA